MFLCTESEREGTAKKELSLKKVWQMCGKKCGSHKSVAHKVWQGGRVAGTQPFFLGFFFRLT